MATEWRTTDAPPGWREGGWVELRNGDKVSKGWIGFDSIGDTPIIELEVGGRRVSFFDFEEWRQVS